MAASTVAATELLQVNVLKKEENRLANIRARNNERLVRFLNARNRTIGLDVDALHAQIEEKRRLKEAEKQAELLEAARHREIARILEGREQEERLARKADLESFKAEWENQKAALKAKKTKQLDFGEPPEKCGMASLQKLAGEDKQSAQRHKLQAEQMKSWVLQQVEEKRIRSLVEAAEDQKYAEFIKHVADLSERQQKAEEQMHKALTKQIQRENQARAIEKGERRAAESNQKLHEDKELLERVSKDPILNEANDFSIPGTLKLRRDHFRGYTSAQRNQIIKENFDLIQQRADQREAEKWKETVYAAQQEAWRRCMEEQEWQEKVQRKQLAKEAQSVLLQQREQQTERAKMSKKGAFGTVGSGFFDGFGRSCR